MDAGRIIDTDGIGAPLMARVCAWCKKDLGAVVCEASQAGKISHGICEPCKAVVLAEARLNPFAGVSPRNNEAVTASALSNPPGIERPLTVYGVAESADHQNPPQLDEHARARPAASFTLLPLKDDRPSAAFIAFHDKLLRDLFGGNGGRP